MVTNTFKSLIIIGVLAITAAACGSTPQKETSTTVQQTQNKQEDPEAKAKADAEAKAKAEADAKKKAEDEVAAKAKAAEEAKKKAEADAKANEEAKAAYEEQVKHPHWNTGDMYVTSNGNLPLAIELLKVTGDITKTATSPAPSAVQKAPWNYYGKPVKLTGTVGIVQDYPPGNNLSVEMGGTASEIVMFTDDGAFVDTLLSVSSGTVKMGDSVTVFGYPVGLIEGENKMGGKTTQLVLVGNTYGTN